MAAVTVVVQVGKLAVSAAGEVTFQLVTAVKDVFATPATTAVIQQDAVAAGGRRFISLIARPAGNAVSGASENAISGLAGTAGALGAGFAVQLAMNFYQDRNNLTWERAGVHTANAAINSVVSAACGAALQVLIPVPFVVGHSSSTCPLSLL